MVRLVLGSAWEIFTCEMWTKVPGESSVLEKLIYKDMIHKNIITIFTPHPKGGVTYINAFFWKNLTFVSKLQGNPYFLPPRKIGFPHAIRGKLWPTKTSKVQLAVWECFSETSSTSLNNIYWNPCFSNITGFLPCSKYSRYHAQTITSAWGCKRKHHCLTLLFHWLAGLILFSRQTNKRTMDVYI